MPKTKRTTKNASSLRTETSMDPHQEMLSVLSHDLRNPLGVVLVTATLLEREVGADPIKKRQVDALKRAAREMSQVIDDLLDVAQIDAGAFSPAKERFLPAALVEEATAAAAQALCHRPFVVAKEIGSDLPAINADRARLLQVFSRIIDDAARFMPNGGTITLGVRSEKQKVTFFVNDTGRALTADERALLFSRSAPKPRRVCRGTGLAMFVAKNIVQAHDGTIDVLDTDRAGNTISFTLPRAARAKKKV